MFIVFSKSELSGNSCTAGCLHNKCNKVSSESRFNTVPMPSQEVYIVTHITWSAKKKHVCLRTKHGLSVRVGYYTQNKAQLVSDYRLGT